MRTKTETIEAINAVERGEWIARIDCYPVDGDDTGIDNAEQAAGIRVDIETYRTFGQKDEQRKYADLTELEKAIESLGVKLIEDGGGDAGNGPIRCYKVDFSWPGESPLGWPEPKRRGATTRTDPDSQCPSTNLEGQT